MRKLKTMVQRTNLTALLRRVRELEADGYECAHPIKKREKSKIYSSGYMEDKKKYRNHETVHYIRYYVQMIKEAN